MEENHTPIRTRNRKSRGKGIRKTTGCLTCRKRHVKCDESQPICGRCRKGSYSCSYSKPSTNPNYTSNSNDNDTDTDRVANEDETNLFQAQESTTGSSSLRWADQQQQQLANQQQPPTPSTPRVDGFRPLSSSGTVNRQPDQPAHVDDDRPRSAFLPNETISTETAPIPIQQYGPSPEALSACGGTGYSMASGGSGGVRTTSAISQLSYNAAITRWFDLLATDADLDASHAFDTIEDLPSTHGESPRELNTNTPRILAPPYEGFPVGRQHRTLSTTSSSQLLKERGPVYDAFKASEKQQWLSSDPLQLLPHEHVLFQNFILHISRWMDLFDPWSNFSTFVPHLAMHNVGLMKAILTLSSRHFSLNSNAIQEAHDRNDSLQYYNETLHFVAKAMQYDSYKTSLELLATALIVSTYEMLDGSGRDWERHLQGVFWIQRSQVIHGDSKGLKAAVWWAWLCQDIWAAFQEHRKTFTFWKPVRTYDDMNPHELAVRSVFLIARVIDYCSREELEACAGNMQIRLQEADRLTQTLEEWHQYLTAEFNPLPWGGPPNADSVFEPIWIHPPSFAVAIQLYNAAQLLLLINRPSRGGLNEFLWQSKLKQKCVANICGIAMTLNDYASSILSSQCIFIAGTCVQDSKQREAVLILLQACRQKSGWPIKPLGQELSNLWAEGGDG